MWVNLWGKEVFWRPRKSLSGFKFHLAILSRASNRGWWEALFCSRKRDCKLLSSAPQSKGGTRRRFPAACHRLTWVYECATLHVHVRSFSCVWLLRCHGLEPTRLLCPCDFPGKNSGVSCHFLLQGIFLTQGLAAGYFTTVPRGEHMPLLALFIVGTLSVCKQWRGMRIWGEYSGRVTHEQNA